MTYTPRIDDYVKWNNIEGWVYFVDDEYITIEIFVKDKPDNLVIMHKKVHCLILCHWHRWHELEYVKSRSVTN